MHCKELILPPKSPRPSRREHQGQCRKLPLLARLVSFVNNCTIDLFVCLYIFCLGCLFTFIIQYQGVSRLYFCKSEVI